MLGLEVEDMAEVRFDTTTLPRAAEGLPRSSPLAGSSGRAAAAAKGRMRRRTVLSAAMREVMEVRLRRGYSLAAEALSGHPAAPSPARLLDWASMSREAMVRVVQTDLSPRITLTGLAEAMAVEAAGEAGRALLARSEVVVAEAVTRVGTAGRP